MIKKMKVLNLHAIGDLQLEEIPVPELGKDEVLVKVAYCGICGSDIPRVYSKGTYHFPTVIGHEFSGIVEYDPTGELTDRKVAVFPLLPCFKCNACKKQNYACCEDYDYYGSRRNGGMAEYIAVKRWNIIVLPEGADLKAAAMCEPVAVAHAAAKKIKEISGKKILISGAGPIGLIAACWCKIFGAYDVAFLDIDKDKLDFALEKGFSVFDKNIQYDAAIEGTGVVLASLVNAVKPEAQIVILGNPEKDVLLPSADYQMILRKELLLCGSWNSRYKAEEDDWQAAIEAMAQGILKPEQYISHVFDIEDGIKAFEMMRDKTNFFVKVLIKL